MTADPLQQAIAAEKRRRGAPWTYHERDEGKLTESVKKMIKLRLDIRCEFPSMPAPVLEHCVKRFSRFKPSEQDWEADSGGQARLIVVEFACFLERQDGSDSDKLLKQWKGSKCTHQ